MEIFALALQERQKTWKIREQFSKFDLLAEDSAELSTYLTSSSAKRRRQAFNHQGKKRFYTTLTSLPSNATTASVHKSGSQLHLSQPAPESSSGDSNDATTVSDESENCSFDHNNAVTPSVQQNTSMSNNSAAFKNGKHHHHNLLSVCVPELLSRSMDNRMDLTSYLHPCRDEQPHTSRSGPSRPTNKINGSFQSPINLTSSEAMHDPRLLDAPLTAHYQLTRDFELINTGYVLQLSMRPRQLASAASEFNLYDYANGYPQLTQSESKMGTESILMGGPLEPNCEYQLIDIIFHWGKETDRGSEHTVNFKAYPMEVQLVHWNCSLYSSYEEALGKPNGICICALFVQIGREHSTLKMIIDHIEEVQFRGRSKRITTALSPSSFLPDPALRDYWAYPGSLTIPPCHENVTWILYRYPLTISHSQLEEFRRLKTFTRGEAPTAGYEGQMVDNFRPTQALCDRKIRASFKP